jgi:hypothetical protein
MPTGAEMRVAKAKRDLARAWLSPTIAFGQASRHELLPHKYPRIHLAALEGLVLASRMQMLGIRQFGMVAVELGSAVRRAHLSNLVAKKTFSIVSWPILA